MQWFGSHLISSLYKNVKINEMHDLQTASLAEMCSPVTSHFHQNWIWNMKI